MWDSRWVEEGGEAGKGYNAVEWLDRLAVTYLATQWCLLVGVVVPSSILKHMTIRRMIRTHYKMMKKVVIRKAWQRLKRNFTLYASYLVIHHMLINCVPRVRGSCLIEGAKNPTDAQ